MQRNLPILITGSHRSGSTWVGKIIAESENVTYFTEPLNPENNINKSIFKNKVQKIWFPAIQYLNKQEYKNGYDILLNKKLYFQNINSFKCLKFAILLNFKKLINKKSRALLKDPIALFSSEWLFNTFKTQNVVLIRKPEAFISSLKKNNWSFDFNNLYKQKNLIENELSDFADEIEMFSKQNNHNIIEQGILLWNIFHSYISNLKKKHPNWYFVTHEQLSTNPIEEFEKIFEYLNLRFSKKVKKYILKTTNTKNQVDRDNKEVHVLNRNSLKNISTWKDS